MAAWFYASAEPLMIYQYADEGSPFYAVRELRSFSHRAGILEIFKILAKRAKMASAVTAMVLLDSSELGLRLVRLWSFYRTTDMAPSSTILEAS